MNQATDPLIQLTEILSKKGSGIICLPENPSLDAVAAAIALYYGLISKFIGSGENPFSLSVIASRPVDHDLHGTEEIQTSFEAPGNSLLISFPYTEGSIEKVDYSIDNDRFNLIVAPRQGYPKLDSKEVKYSYTGGDVDFIITIDTSNLKGLGKIYTDHPEKFEGKTIINIDRHLTNSFFGKVNLVSKSVSSTSEIVLTILKRLDCVVDKEMATNLYSGLVSATNNFSSFSVNSDTFQTAAELLKLGAAKKSKNTEIKRSFGLEKQTVKPIETVEKESRVAGEGEAEKTPDDWLKPKIFSSKSLS